MCRCRPTYRTRSRSLVSAPDETLLTPEKTTVMRTAHSRSIKTLTSCAALLILANLSGCSGGDRPGLAHLIGEWRGVARDCQPVAGPDSIHRPSAAVMAIIADNHRHASMRYYGDSVFVYLADSGHVDLDPHGPLVATNTVSRGRFSLVDRTLIERSAPERGIGSGRSDTFQLSLLRDTLVQRFRSSSQSGCSQVETRWARSRGSREEDFRSSSGTEYLGVWSEKPDFVVEASLRVSITKSGSDFAVEVANGVPSGRFIGHPSPAGLKVNLGLMGEQLLVVSGTGRTLDFAGSRLTRR